MFTGADVVLWGGETTVRCPRIPARGGRNQHLALAAARLLAGHEDAVLLAAGTDGIDGNSVDAGAIVDGGTIARGRAAGLDAGEALAHADAGTFLEATGDLLHTGADRHQRRRPAHRPARPRRRRSSGGRGDERAVPADRQRPAAAPPPA